MEKQISHFTHITQLFHTEPAPRTKSPEAKSFALRYPSFARLRGVGHFFSRQNIFSEIILLKYIYFYNSDTNKLFF